MWNSDIPPYTNDTDPLYQSIPFFIGIRSLDSSSAVKKLTVFSLITLINHILIWEQAITGFTGLEQRKGK